MKRFQILFLLCLALSFTFSIFAKDKDTKEVIILQTSDMYRTCQSEGGRIL